MELTVFPSGGLGMAGCSLSAWGKCLLGCRVSIQWGEIGNKANIMILLWWRQCTFKCVGGVALGCLREVGGIFLAGCIMLFQPTLSLNTKSKTCVIRPKKQFCRTLFQCINYDNMDECFLLAIVCLHKSLNLNCQALCHCATLLRTENSTRLVTFSSLWLQLKMDLEAEEMCK